MSKNKKSVRQIAYKNIYLKNKEDYSLPFKKYDIHHKDRDKDNNRTNTIIDLTDWTITIGTTEKQFPLSIIEPDSFVILIKDEVIDSFSNNISKIGFSSISLTNRGADLNLKDNNGKVINTISYTDKWYNDDNKNEGGRFI